ncbi:MAG: transglutaminase family protein [Cytophagales bacterium]|nr:transglutaminase family protein [Armatimonadota bacterium]
MLIRIGYDIAVTVAAPTPMVLMLSTRPELKTRFQQPDTLRVLPDTVATHEYVDGFGNLCTRLVAPPGSVTFHADAVIEGPDTPDPTAWDAPQHPIEALPHETLEFLIASRYCEVDKLSGFAWDTFGTTPPGWGRVQAVCDFAHHHVTFGYHFADSTKTAVDVLNDGTGVCRDYQHLAVTLCRCLGVPARYATGYLGDINVPLSDGPMDFSAWFEVYLGDRWWAFDARYNTPRYGRTLMAVGRDAADVALITSFGAHALDRFDVICEKVVDGNQV